MSACEDGATKTSRVTGSGSGRIRNGTGGTGPTSPSSPEQADRHVERIREIVAEQDGLAWPRTDDRPDASLPVALAVVADRATDELVGTVSWHWESQETEWARMGISIYDPGLRGSGRGTDALALWTSYLFGASTWRRLDYSTWSGNTAMARVGEKLGFTMEGCFRQARVVRGEIYDSVVTGQSSRLPTSNAAW